MRKSVAIGMLLCALPFSSCSAKSQPNYQDVPETKVLSYRGYVDEYHASLKTLTWPQGYTPPATPTIQDKSGSYEVGSGEGAAAGAWLCAWEGSYLKNRTQNPSMAKQALARLDKFDQLPAWTRAYSDPNTRKWILGAFDKARLGDPSGIAQDYKANCP